MNTVLKIWEFIKRNRIYFWCALGVVVFITIIQLVR
jgi:hypothetical protein